MQFTATSLDFTKENLATLCALSTESEEEGQAIIPIGKQRCGLITENFATIPSSLIVGTTGSGKSAFVKTAIVELMQKYTPEQVRIAIYDSRCVDYSFLNANPFLLAPVYTDHAKAMGLIQWSLIEARKRMNNFELLKESPHIFIILDDFGEMSLSNDTLSDLVQLFQIARRTKIHFWLITSTPSSHVLPTDLKANINHRIVFRVSSKSISRIVLDDVGAELLNAPGEIIVKLNNTIVKCESVFLDDADIEALSKEITKKYPSSTTSVVVGDQSPTVKTNSFIEENWNDVLYNAAVDEVLETKQASVSLLQRRLKLGYARAARLIDQMEKDGIVGPFDGSKPRLILISRDQWQQIQQGKKSDISPRTDEVSSIQSKSNNAVSQDYDRLLTPQKLLLASGALIRSIDNYVFVRINDEEYTILGQSITELLFKKPGFFRKGNLSIRFSASEYVGDMIASQKTVVIPFESRETTAMKAFCKQLVEDISVPVIES